MMKERIDEQLDENSLTRKPYAARWRLDAAP